MLKRMQVSLIITGTLNDLDISFPGLYTRISSVMEWIKSIVPEVQEGSCSC